jgi:hypothetical protein
MNKINHLIRYFLMATIGMSVLSPAQAQNTHFQHYSNPEIENTDVYKNGNIYQKDLLLFMNILEACHPAFAPGQAFPFNIDSVRQTGYQWASGCRSNPELKTYLQAIASWLNDGHTTLSPDINKNFVYPFAFFTDNQQVYLRGINKEQESFLGKQIAQINGRPVFDVVNSFKQTISSDNEVYFLDKVNDFMQLYSVWENNPYCLPDSSLTLTFTDATQVTLRPLSVKEINMALQQPKNQPITVRKNNKQPFQYTLLSDKGIGYLQFNACSDQSTLRYQYYMNNPDTPSEELEKKVAQYPRFDAFLTEMFQAIETNQIQTLVIDVRNNVGGNSKLCDILLSWLKPQKEIKSNSSLIRFSGLWEQHYPALAAEYRRSFAEAKQTFEIGKLYDTAFLSQVSDKQQETSVWTKINDYFQMNNDESKVFKGSVIFIQNARTYSSAGMLITDATDNGIGIVIGNKSAYKPCSYGDILAWELPDTKITGWVSHKIFNRPDRSQCDELSLTPAIYLPATWADVLEGKDIYWEWILEHYSNKQQ